MHPTPSTSASPAPFRVTSASRHTDGPSPSKRRKLTTPQPALNSSSNLDKSGSTSDPQLDTERRASSSRVLNVWSALEDKYARRLDEDDIVDLRSGGLVKDRGVLSSKDGTWDIGCFADPKAAQGNENSPQEDDDDDEDEIGVWSPDSVLDHQFNPVHVPPVHELDPEDAEDLRAFLAAEEARKPFQGVDFSEDEDDLDVTRRGTDFDPEIDESVVEIEVGSAPALPPTDSDDELAGYDDTVGEGALLWEVGTELSHCTEPLGAESGAVIKPLHALPRRNQTPAQLRTPPVSRSSAREPNELSFPRTSTRPLRRQPIDLPPPSPPNFRKRSPWTSSKKKVSSNQPSPDGGNKVVAPLSIGKGKARELSLSPTKNLIAEVTLPMPRASTVFRQCEDGMLNHDDVPRTPTQPRRRDSISQSEGNYAVKHQKRPPTLPKRSVKSKMVVSDETDTDVDVGNDDDHTKGRRARERRVSESYAKPVDLSESLSSRRRRHSTPGPLRRPTTSASLEDSSSPHHDLRRSPSYHPHPTPSFLSHDFWPPYPHHAHTPTPSFPAFYPPPPKAMRELSVAPSPEVQIHIAQAMQSLSYLAFGLPPPPPSSSAFPPHSHSLHTPPSSSPPSSMRSHPAPYFPYHTQGHPPWYHPPSPYPYPYPSVTHTHPPASSSAASSTMPNSFPEPPSSPPDVSSSPLSGRRKRKHVSFPEDVVESEYESRSGSDTDSDMDSDTDVGDVGDGASVRKEKGKGGQVLNTITPSRRSRKDSQELSKGSGSRYRNSSPRRRR